MQQECYMLYLSDAPDSPSSFLQGKSGCSSFSFFAALEPFPFFIIEFCITVHLISYLCSPYCTSLGYCNFGEKPFNWTVINCWDCSVSHQRLEKTQRILQGDEINFIDCCWLETAETDVNCWIKTKENKSDTEFIRTYLRRVCKLCWCPLISFWLTNLDFFNRTDLKIHPLRKSMRGANSNRYSQFPQDSIEKTDQNRCENVPWLHHCCFLLLFECYLWRNLLSVVKVIPWRECSQHTKQPFWILHGGL